MITVRRCSINGRLLRRQPIDGRLRWHVGRENRYRDLWLHEWIRCGSSRLGLDSGFWRSLYALVVGVLRHSPRHSRTADLREIQFAAHTWSVRERFLVLGQHRVLNGCWRLVSVIGNYLRSLWRCILHADKNNRSIQIHCGLITHSS